MPPLQPVPDMAQGVEWPFEIPIRVLSPSSKMTREQRFTFNEVGDQYDRYRPGYPEPLFEDLLSLSGISLTDRVLEIGCGTGQATRPLAQRGFAMSCLEPGSHTASIARASLKEGHRKSKLRFRDVR